MFVYLLLLFSLGISNALDSITPTQPLRDGGDTLVSPNGIFEMGFFSPGSSSKRYLGIWYQKVETVAWVANRENSLSDKSGVLSITSQGNLVLSDGRGVAVWSSNSSRSAKNPVLKLLESGNLVVEISDDKPNEFLWESFDHPSDTLFPEMKLGTNFVTKTFRALSSWKSRDDPAPGDFSLEIDTRGFPQLVLKKQNAFWYRAGSWNGIHFTGAPNLQPENPICTYQFELTENEVYYKCETKNYPSRLVVNQTGLIERSIYLSKGSWYPIYYEPVNQCDHYAFCDAHASCNNNSKPICSCLEGFVPKSPNQWNMSNWSQGCVRRSQLNCKSVDRDRFHFQTYSRLKLPDTSASWYNRSMNLDQCKEKCSKNCSCTAYAASNFNATGCLLWFSKLIDMIEYINEGQDLYIRMAKIETENQQQINARPDRLKSSTKAGMIVGLALLVAILAAVGSILYIRKKKLIKNQGLAGSDHSDMELLLFDFNTIDKATDNFSNSNKLGEGGFGPVYKGILVDGQEIAVKRLSKSSGQGVEEFKTEVKLIAKLQHRNLVKLLGCCIQADENMLIYEYMPNASLDYFIFGDSRNEWLNWQMCMRIIGGIDRGILYLHQDSRMRIIHRDLKASNILLDNDMNPKISDFGMARIFGGDEPEVNTSKVVGTYGYMAPEYAVDGVFSVKSDVYSFGVLVLEIISGKKNRGFSHPEHDRNLLGHAWILWTENRLVELIGKMTDNSCPVPEILRFIHVGLLCVQQRPEDRPNMSSVVLMLSSENPLPEPKQPGFFTERNLPVTEKSPSQNASSTTNELTFSILEAR